MYTFKMFISFTKLCGETLACFPLASLMVNHPNSTNKCLTSYLYIVLLLAEGQFAQCLPFVFGRMVFCWLGLFYLAHFLSLVVTKGSCVE
ncbi:hypothetical protein XELAEV_18008045mg [Xenopus laevis]|uniref:Uncharacterized protein n=1 Tax=Xenopus laevis TaxID=8355 RepID=A0A974E2B7_XENLA|nr:hypothetical protein XELAEV_18008045mg [Xenopus laevis]